MRRSALLLVALCLGVAPLAAAKDTPAKDKAVKQDGSKDATDKAAAAKDKAAAAPPADDAAKGGDGELWRVTTTIQIPGAPSAPPPITYEYCKTSKDVVPRNSADPQASGCKIIEHKFDAQQGVWKMVCEREGMQMTGEGRIAYSGDTFKGELRIKTSGQGQAFEMTQQMSGQKLGRCKR